MESGDPTDRRQEAPSPTRSITLSNTLKLASFIVSNPIEKNILFHILSNIYINIAWSWYVYEQGQIQNPPPPLKSIVSDPD